MRGSYPIILAAIFVVLSSATGVAAPAFTAVSATLRDGPGTNYPSILVIPRGTEVEVIGCERGWCEVELAEEEGFIRQDLLGFLDAGPPIVVFPPAIYQYGYRYWREHNRDEWGNWRQERGRPSRRYERPPSRYQRPPAGRPGQPNLTPPPPRSVQPGAPPPPAPGRDRERSRPGQRPDQPGPGPQAPGGGLPPPPPPPPPLR